jgi:hypothetical protein
MSSYRKGQRFLVTEERRVPILIHWGAPITTGVTAPLPIGTVLVVTQDPLPASRGVYTAPEAYERLERDLVPEHDLRDETYDGYSIVVGDDEIGAWLEPID